MSKIFTRLYTGNTVIENGGKCFKQLAPDLTETWVWNATITDWPVYILDGANYNDMDDEKLIHMRQTLLHNIDFECNGVKYNNMLYGRTISYNVSGFSDGYTMDFILYARNYDVTDATSDANAFAYVLENNHSIKGWQDTKYKTVTYSTIPKDADLLAFRNKNASKTNMSVMSLTGEIAVDNPAISTFMSLLIAQ